MSQFVSGWKHPLDPSPYAKKPDLITALKSIEAGVKGFGKRGTPESKARDDAIMGESREDPLAGWHPVIPDDELRFDRLTRVDSSDVPCMRQLELFNHYGGEMDEKKNSTENKKGSLQKKTKSQKQP